MKTVTTPKQLNKYFQGFADGFIPFLIVQSTGGHGKTYGMEQIRDKQQRNIKILSGHVTPMSFYATLYENPTALIVLDDVIGTFTNKTLNELLKQASELKDIKPVRYNTTATLKDDDGKEIPSEFMFRGRVAILTNKIPKGDMNQQALLTRAVRVFYKPTNEELLKIMSNFPKEEKDKEILEFLTDMAQYTKLNFRQYKLCQYLAEAGIDYKTHFYEMYGISNELIEREHIFKKHENKELNKTQTIIELMNVTGKSKRQCYNYYKERYNKK